MLSKPEVEIETGDQSFAAELASNVLSRAIGLSFRTKGKMLFAFSRDSKAFIDMMLVSKPLHLYFLNSQKEVIDVQKARPWGIDPWSWKLYRPSSSYRYLLESFEKLDIEEGETLEFEI